MCFPRFVFSFSGFVALLTVCCILAADQAVPDVQTIITRSVAANEADFQAAPQFTYQERDRGPDGTKTYQISMMEGTPYQRLITVNGKPLSPQAKANEERKQREALQERQSESAEERRRRIAQFEKDRRRDHALMQQLTKAFDFKLIGKQRMASFNVYVLQATPRPSYHPPNLETQVLTGMQGRLWVDQMSYQWVKVTAQVVRPVSIAGFLAQVQPGTRFELEKRPVEERIWQPSHFAMNSQAKVLFLFNKSSQENQTFFNYKRTE